MHRSPIFGPVKSRRLGISLGINVMPDDGKWCSFDCVYCECGLNKDHRPSKPLPTVGEIEYKLRERLAAMKERTIVGHREVLKAFGLCIQQKKAS